MDPAIASIIAAIIGMLGAVLITTRAAVPTRPVANAPPMPAPRRFRAAAWGFVAFLYALAAGFAFAGYVEYDLLELKRASHVFSWSSYFIIVVFWTVSIACSGVGLWAHRRLTNDDSTGYSNSLKGPIHHR